MGVCLRLAQVFAVLAIVFAIFLARFLQTPVVQWNHFDNGDTYYDTMHNFVRFSIVSIPRGVHAYGGVDLEVWEAGPTTGKALLLIHGFPENGLVGWKHQIPFFASKGFHVISPNKRCYNHSLPYSGDLKECNPDAAAADFSYLLRHLNHKSAIVIGHDWGATTAYAFAKTYPAQVERLAILQIPHPAVFKHYLLTTTQVLHSWYMFFFQLPTLAENFIRKENYSFLISWGIGSSFANSFSVTDVDRLLGAWEATNRTLSAMLGYYRWIPSQLFSPPEPDIPESLPFLFIYGAQDAYVDARMVQPTINDHAPHGKAIVLPGTHWVQHDVPDSVNHHLLAFIQPS